MTTISRHGRRMQSFAPFIDRGEMRVRMTFGLKPSGTDDCKKGTRCTKRDLRRCSSMGVRLPDRRRPSISMPCRSRRSPIIGGVLDIGDRGLSTDPTLPGSSGADIRLDSARGRTLFLTARFSFDR